MDGQLKEPVEQSPEEMAAREKRAEEKPREDQPTGGGLIRSFHFAFSGLWHLLKTQRNARVEVFLGLCACGLGAWLKISRAEWAVLVFTIALVLILEGLNTSIEAAVDLASPQRHPLAKSAKDLAAGMVLIAALASIAVGLLILGPPLWQKFFG